jgi:competence ComEA-like helix-hairpin-helix protein
MLRIFFFAMAILALASPQVRAEKIQLEGVVNINTASPDELSLIPGVGPARVRNILAYRHAHPFRTVEELARIKGIGRKTVRHWRMHLAVGGPSTAQKVVRPDLPVVGPPQLPAQVSPAPSPPRAPPRSMIPSRPLYPQQRRGEPAHALSGQSAGNSCLPPR